MILNFKLIYVMALFWFILAIWTGLGNLTFAPTDIDSLIESGLQPQSVNLDRPIVGSDDPISTNVIVPSTENDWVDFFWNSARLDSHIWEGWAGAIRNFFLVGSGLFGLALIVDGARTLAGFVRGG